MDKSTGATKGGIALNDLHELLATKVDRVSPNDLPWTIIHGGRQTITTSMSLPGGG